MVSAGTRAVALTDPLSTFTVPQIRGQRPIGVNLSGMMLALGGEIASIAGGEIFTISATFLFRFLGLKPMGHRPRLQQQVAERARTKDTTLPTALG
jgi:hypothetical protein